MNRAERIIDGAERAAKSYQDRTGCDASMACAFKAGWLAGEIRALASRLDDTTNPPGCTEVESDGVRYGLKWNKGDECWEIFIGGQCVNVALSGGLIDKLCEEAERIALDGEAA